MSHAVVLVIGENIDDQMSPYSESLEVEPYKDRVTFSDDSWPGSIIAKKAPEVDLLDPAECARWLNARYSDGDEKYEVDDQGAYQWSTYNPQSKWDWWQIGGRWAGTLLVKPLVTAAAPNVKVNPFSAELAAQERKHFEPVMDGRHTDRARKGEIDWEGMALDRLGKIASRWDRYEELVRERGREAADKAAWWDLGLDDEEVAMGRDAHLAQVASVNPLYWVQAVLGEGVWREKGTMGWFGCSSDGPEEREQWNTWITRFLAGLGDEAVLTVVDYHI